MRPSCFRSVIPLRQSVIQMNCLANTFSKVFSFCLLKTSAACPLFSLRLSQSHVTVTRSYGKCHSKSLTLQKSAPLFHQFSSLFNRGSRFDRNIFALTMATSCEREKPRGEVEGAEQDPLKNKDDAVIEDASRMNVKDSGSTVQSAAKPQMSKRAQKKMLRREKLKELRKAKRAANFTKNSNPGFDCDIFSETDYYFENGLRKVYPYHYTFSSYAKERWYGRTIQDIFENEFRVDSPDNFRTSVAKGNMRVNGNNVGLGYVLKNGDLMEHHIHRHENPVSGTPIEIVEDTPELVVINKPASIPCHPCGKFRFNSIVFILGKEYGYANLRNIYRLDRLTSGVLILGKTAKKTKELENQVLHRQVQKEYLARVVGEFPSEEVEVDEPLDCLSHKLTLWQVKKGGKPSRTTFQRLGYNGKTSLVKCMPHTGRTHQIRVHLQFLGYPIVNDPYYNSPSWGPLRGKGGHCDVPHEELCNRIMQEHNVGMWCEGEKADSLSTTADNKSLEDIVSPVKDILMNCDHPESLSTTEKTNPETRDLRSPSTVAPQPKRIKLSTEDGTEDNTKKDSCSSTPLSVAGTPVCEEDIAGGTGHQDSTDVSITSLSTGADEEARTASKDGCEAQSEVEAKSMQEEDGAAPVGKDFDPERCVPDPLCESCRLKYIDPKPCDLLLYLHAVRYKGPTWEYSTKLPDWAAEDWEEPEEYHKYLH